MNLVNQIEKCELDLIKFKNELKDDVYTYEGIKLIEYVINEIENELKELKLKQI
jgi:hypothetical protein